MSKSALPFTANDISAVARSLKDQLSNRTDSPGHVELLNMLARSTGYRNFQHWRADLATRQRLDNPAPHSPTPSIDLARIERLLRCYDDQGRLLRWPPKQSQRLLTLWVLWSKVPARQDLTEAQVNERLQALHHFGDHALLRRLLCDHGLMERTRDGAVYRRIEQPMPDEATALLRHLKARTATGAHKSPRRLGRQPASS
jgi:hypothetical protein